MFKKPQNIETTEDFQCKACKALKTKELMGGGRSLLLIQAACQPESFLLNFLTPCPPAWGVVVYASAAFGAPASGAVPPPAEADIV